jgi:hypothetical protein
MRKKARCGTVDADDPEPHPVPRQRRRVQRGDDPGGTSRARPNRALAAGVILAAAPEPDRSASGPSRQGYERGTTMSEVTEQQLEDMEALFVQTAASMTSGGGSLTLHGLSPSTLYFADRPQRETGHMSSGQFVANWAEGDNSFADYPPTPSCRSRSRATGLRRMRSWSSRIRTWTGTRSPTASRSSTAPCRLPPGHARCSSTHWGVRCHRSP